MELKNILSKIKNTDKKKEKEKLFFALEISYETLKAAVWTIREERAVILKMGTVEEWDERDEESFEIAAKNSLEKSSQDIEKKPNEVIFGLPKDWVKGKQVSEGKKGLLRKVCEGENLQAVGFVVTIEALLEYLKIKEGVPSNAIFINLEETQIAVFWVEIGRMRGFEKVGRSSDLAADVREALARFGDNENFPARMVLFDGLVDFEEAKQQLMSFPWEEKLSFHHIPKIQSLGSNIGLKAVAVAGGSEVAKSLGFAISSEKEEEKGKDLKADSTLNAEQKDKPEIGKELDKAEIKVDKESESSNVPEKQTENTSIEKNKTFKDKVKELKDSEEKPLNEVLSAEDVGFTSKGDILEEVTKAENELKEQKKTEIRKPTLKKSQLKDFEKEKTKNNLFAKIKKIPNKFTHFLRKMFGKKLAVALIISVLVLGGIAAGGIYAYWNIPRAEINIIVSPKILEKEMEFTLTTNSSDEENAIEAESLEKKVQAQESKETTGTKLIGEKATGEVTIFNKTDVDKTFESGTILIGNDNLKYLLEEEINVASKSSETIDGGEKITYGKAKVKISAASIGSDYNTAEDTEFKIQEYSSAQFTGAADSEITGGVSREVSAVDEADVSSLRDTLKSELLKKAKQELRESVSENEEVIITEDQEIVSEELSSEVGEEADNVTLTIELALQAYAYDKSKLENQLKKSFFQLVPRGYTLKDEKISMEVKETIVEDSEVYLKVNSTAMLVPKVNKEDLKEKLSGKSPEVAQGYLNTIPNYIEAEILIIPRLPEFVEIIPHKKENISINVKTN